MADQNGRCVCVCVVLVHTSDYLPEGGVRCGIFSHQGQVAQHVSVEL